MRVWGKLGDMLTHFPKAVPEIPVSNVEKAAEYYVNVLGFRFDWGNDEGGIGGISQGECRIFLANAPSANTMAMAGWSWYG
jgi:catechol 2,3-dioxygenase-like lactoylglutathione lyase family enzyme